MRNGADLYKRIEVLFEKLLAADVLGIEIPADIGAAVVCGILENVECRRPIVFKFAIIAEGHAATLTIVPDKSVGRIRDGTVPVKIIITTAAAIVTGPGLFREVGRISRHRPVMAIGTDFRVDIKIIQQDKLIHQRMGVRGDLLSKKT